ncbi:hypothetical protein Tco_0777450 [Tanacetum coccineum]
MVGPRVVNPLNARNSTAACGEYIKCDGTDHYKAACPRLNRAPRPGGNHPNQVMAIEGGQGYGNNGNQARGRAFVIGAEEARHDLNKVTGMFTLNNYYATTLFDSVVDYSFVSTTFIPLLDIEPNNLGAQVMWIEDTTTRLWASDYNKKPFVKCAISSAIAISCNTVQHSRAKHIHTRYHFIKEHVENGIIKLYIV